MNPRRDTARRWVLIDRKSEEDVGFLILRNRDDDYDALRRELIVRANAEDGQPHRTAQLAWFSGRPEVPAGDALAWARDQTKAVLAEHGSLARLREWHAADEAERHHAMVAQLAANQQAAEAWTRRSIDAEKEGARVAEGEVWLREHEL